MGVVNIDLIAKPWNWVVVLFSGALLFGLLHMFFKNQFQKVP